MKVRIILTSGKERDFKSIKDLKDYCSCVCVTWRASLLDSIQVFALDSGKRVPFPHDIKTLYDFIDYYRI